MKKIVFYIFSLCIGGSEKACIRAANALCNEYDVTVQTFVGNGELEIELDERVHLRSTFPRFIRGLARLNYLPPSIAHRLFIGDGYDIEIAVGDGLESHVVSGSRNKNIYSWIHMNLGVYGTHRSEKTLKRFSAFKKIICVSEQNKKCFLKEMQAFFSKTVVLYSPIDKSEILQKADFSIADSNRYITIGRLEKVKGFDRLIKAIHEFTPDSFHLDIYGDGTQKEELQSMIDRYGLNEIICLKGKSNNPYPYIRSAKALICPSVEESFGFSVVEAMLLRTPVIATRCGGTEEIIQSSAQGMLCDNSIEGLVEALKSIDNGNYDIDLEQAYQRACDFSVEMFVSNFGRIIES